MNTYKRSVVKTLKSTLKSNSLGFDLRTIFRANRFCTAQFLQYRATQFQQIYHRLPNFPCVKDKFQLIRLLILCTRKQEKKTLIDQWE